jgi:hypothetical protein
MRGKYKKYTHHRFDRDECDYNIAKHVTAHLRVFVDFFFISLLAHIVTPHTRVIVHRLASLAPCERSRLWSSHRSMLGCDEISELRVMYVWPAVCSNGGFYDQHCPAMRGYKGSQ